MFQRCASSRQGGFSYIGLLIMIMIFGAMSAAVLSAGSMMQRRAAEEELLFIGEQFQSAFKSFYDSTPIGARPYPAQLSDLLRDQRFPVIRRHLRKIYADPLTGIADWGIVDAPGGGIFGVYSRSDEIPIRISGFNDNFARFEGAKKYSEWVFSADQPQVSTTSNGGIPGLSRR